MPTLPDVVSLGLHCKLAALWRRIGGKLPNSAKGLLHFKKSDILKQSLTKPIPKHERKTKYYKRAAHQYDANLKKVRFLEQCYYS